MSISFAVTAYREMSPGRDYGKKLVKCIGPAQRHEAVSEIVIVDDGSEDFMGLQEVLYGADKVRLFHNNANLGVFGNKLEAIARCQSDWVINCDSDNYMDEAYIDRVRKLPDDGRTWYCPSFARPQFDYRHLIGRWDLSNIKDFVTKPVSHCALNTGNEVVHRTSFMQVFRGYRGRRFDLFLPNYLSIPAAQREDPKWRVVHDAKDSLIFNMQWLLSGGTLEIVEGLEYQHYYTTGAESNYARAPIEKDALNNVLIEELRKASEEANR